MCIRLLIAADDRVLREGVMTMISGTDIEVACQAIDCEQAIRYALTVDPDVVLLDADMLRADDFAALHQIRRECPQVSVLMFSGSENLSHVARARALRANGFLSKRANREELIATVRQVAQGKEAWSRRLLRRISSISEPQRVFGDEELPLTEREREVLKKITEGLTNQEIAEALAVDIETVKDHVKHILKKVVVEDRTQAAIWAIGNKLV